MKDWKAAIRKTWEEKSNGKHQRLNSTGHPKAEPGKYAKPKPGDEIRPE
jgi:hypothetical protein